jgi:hypothetical protein
MKIGLRQTVVLRSKNVGMKMSLGKWARAVLSPELVRSLYG